MSSGDTSSAAGNAPSTEQTPLIAQSPGRVDSVDIESGDAQDTPSADTNTSSKNETKLDAPTSAEEKEDTSGTVSPYPASHDDVGGFTKGCHMFFVAISTLSIAVLACMSVSQIILLSKKKVPFLQFSLRLYILIFCLVFILVELDWPPGIMKSLPTNNWLMRGWLYSFLGLVGMEEAFAVLVSESSSSNILASDLVSIFIQVSSWGMVSIGTLYFGLGLLCMRGLKEKVRTDYYASKDRHRRQSGGPNIQRV